MRWSIVVILTLSAHAASAQSLVESGESLQSAGEHEAALVILQRALAMEDERGRVLHRIAESELALGRRDEAKSHFRAAIALDGDEWVDAHTAEIATLLAEASVVPRETPSELTEIETPASEPTRRVQSSPLVPTERPEETVEIRIVPDTPGTRLYRTHYAGVTVIGTRDSLLVLPTLGEYQLLCRAPCTLNLAVGTHLFGVQEPDDSIVFLRGAVNNHFRIDHPGRIRIAAPGRVGRRVFGFLLMLLSAGGFALGFHLGNKNQEVGADHMPVGSLVGISLSSVGALAGLIALVMPRLPIVEYID